MSLWVAWIFNEVEMEAVTKMIKYCSSLLRHRDKFCEDSRWRKEVSIAIPWSLSELLWILENFKATKILYEPLNLFSFSTLSSPSPWRFSSHQKVTIYRRWWRTRIESETTQFLLMSKFQLLFLTQLGISNHDRGRKPSPI